MSAKKGGTSPQYNNMEPLPHQATTTTNNINNQSGGSPSSANNNNNINRQKSVTLPGIQKTPSSRSASMGGGGASPPQADRHHSLWSPSPLPYGFPTTSTSPSTSAGAAAIVLSPLVVAATGNSNDAATSAAHHGGHGPSIGIVRKGGGGAGITNNNNYLSTVPPPSRTPLHPLPLTPSHRLHLSPSPQRRQSTEATSASSSPAAVAGIAGGGLSVELEEKLDALFSGYAQDAIAMQILIQAREHVELKQQQQLAMEAYEVLLEEYHKKMKSNDTLGAGNASNASFQTNAAAAGGRRSSRTFSSPVAKGEKNKKGRKSNASPSSSPVPKLETSLNSSSKQRSPSSTSDPRQQQQAAFSSPYPTSTKDVSEVLAAGSDAAAGTKTTTTSTHMSLFRTMLQSSALKTQTLATLPLKQRSEEDSKSDGGGGAISSLDASQQPPQPPIPPALASAAASSEAATLELRRVEQFLLRNRRFPARSLSEKIDRLLALSGVVSTKAQQLNSRFPASVRTTLGTTSGENINSSNTANGGGGGVASGYLANLIATLLNVGTAINTQSTSSSSSPPTPSKTDNASIKAVTTAPPSTLTLLDFIPPAYQTLLQNTATTTSSSSPAVTAQHLKQRNPMLKEKTTVGVIVPVIPAVVTSPIDAHLDALDRAVQVQGRSLALSLTLGNNNNVGGGNDTRRQEDEDSADPYAFLPFIGIGSMTDAIKTIRKYHPTADIRGAAAASEATTTFLPLALGGGGGGGSLGTTFNSPLLLTSPRSNMGNNNNPFSTPTSSSNTKSGSRGGTMTMMPAAATTEANSTSILSNTSTSTAAAASSPNNTNNDHNTTTTGGLLHKTPSNSYDRGGDSTLATTANVPNTTPKRGSGAPPVRCITTGRESLMHVSIRGGGLLGRSRELSGSNSINVDDQRSSCGGACQWCYFRSKKEVSALAALLRQDEEEDAPVVTVISPIASNSSNNKASSESGKKNSSKQQQQSAAAAASAARAASSNQQQSLQPSQAPQQPYRVEYDVGSDTDLGRMLALLPSALAPSTLKSVLRSPPPPQPTGQQQQSGKSTPMGGSLPPLPPTASGASSSPNHRSSNSSANNKQQQQRSAAASVPSAMDTTVGTTPTSATNGGGAYAVVEGLEIDMERLVGAILEGLQLLGDKSAALTRRLEASKSAKTQQERDLRIESESLRQEIEELKRLTAQQQRQAQQQYLNTTSDLGGGGTAILGVGGGAATSPTSLHSNHGGVVKKDGGMGAFVSGVSPRGGGPSSSSPHSTCMSLGAGMDIGELHHGGQHHTTTLLPSEANKTIAGLAQRLEERDQQIRKKQSEIHTKDKIIRDLRSDVASRDENIVHLQDELRVERSEVNVVKSQMKDIFSIRGEESKMSSSAIKQLEDSLGDRRAQIITLSRTVEVLKSALNSVGSEWLELDSAQDDTRAVLGALQHELSTLHTVFNPMGLAKEVAQLRQTIAMEHHLRDEQESALATLRQENDHLKLRGRILKSTGKDIVDRVLSSVEWKLLHARAPEESINAQEKLISLLTDSDAKDSELIVQLLEKARGFQLRVENEVSAREQKRRVDVAARFYADFRLGEGLVGGVSRAFPTMSVTQLAGRITAGDATIPSRAVDGLSSYFNSRLLQNEGYSSIFDRQVEAHLATGATTEGGPLPIPDPLKPTTFHPHNNHPHHTSTSPSPRSNSDGGGAGGSSSSPPSASVAVIPSPSPAFSVLPVSTAVALGDLTLVPAMVLDGEDPELDGAAISARQLPPSTSAEFLRAYNARMRRRRRKENVSLTFDVDVNLDENNALMGASLSNTVNSNNKQRMSVGPSRAVTNISQAAVMRTSDYRKGRVAMFLSQLQTLIGSVKGPAAIRSTQADRHRGFDGGTSLQRQLSSDQASEGRGSGGRSDEEGGGVYTPSATTSPASLPLAIMSNTNGGANTSAPLSVVAMMGGAGETAFFAPNSATLAQPLPLEQISFATFIAQMRHVETGRQ